MTTIIELRKHLENAAEIKQKVTGGYRKYREQLNQKLAKIEGNKELSGLGKIKQVELLKRKESATMMVEAKNVRAAYNDQLTKARLIADEIYFANTEPADAVKQERFDKQLAILKTEVLLCKPRQATEKVQEFLAKLDEPALFEQTQAAFAELATPILSSAGPDVNKYRDELGQMFDKARKSALHPDAIEADELAQHIDALIDGRFFSIAVEDAIGYDLGPEVVQYLENPDAYFEKYEEDKALVPVNGIETEAYLLAEIAIEDEVDAE